ncbi:MAG: hypothetical protein WDN28_15680 [Chthoniobacter sp.]
MNVTGPSGILMEGSAALNIGNGTGAGTVTAAGILGQAGTPTLNFDHTDAAYAFAPGIAGTVAVNHLGSGTTTLTGTDTYSGATTIGHGTLQAGSTGAFSLNSAYLLSSGATLDLRGNSNTIGSLADGTGGGTVTNSGAAGATLTPVMMTAARLLAERSRTTGCDRG